METKEALFVVDKTKNFKSGIVSSITIFFVACTGVYRLQPTTMLTVANSDRDGFLKELFKIHDDKCVYFLNMHQIQELYSDVRIGSLSIPQVAASMEYVCGNTDFVGFEDLRELIEELDRRYYLVQDLQWEFALLDNLHTGNITPEKAKFLFQAVHGSLFSHRRWDRFLRGRPVPFAPLSFPEIEVELCNRPHLDEWEVYEAPVPRVAQPPVKVESTKVVSAFQANKMVQVIRPTTPEIPTPRSKNNDLGKADVAQDDSAELKRREAAEAAERNEEQEEKKRRAEEEDERKRKEEEARRHREERKQAKREARRAERAEKKAKATEIKEKLRYDLEDAVDAQERHLLEPAMDAYKGVVSKPASDKLLQRAERLLKILNCKDELKDASARRVVEELEEALKRAKDQGFHRSEDELERECDAADELVLRLKRLERLRAEVLELKQSTIAEIRSYQKPIPIIHKVMTATYLLLGVPEKDTKKWTSIQSLLGKSGKEGLKRRIFQCKINDISSDVATRARHILGDADLESIRDVSAGAATFFVWAEGMIEELLTHQ